MPLYEYKCDGCGNEFSAVLKMKNRKIPLSEECPNCKVSGAIFRVYSISGFVDPLILSADKNMERSGVQAALERIRDNSGRKMVWKG